MLVPLGRPRRAAVAMAAVAALAVLLGVVAKSRAGAWTPGGTVAAASNAADAADAGLTPAKAVVLGVVEGVTEYLPISSTGHLLITERILDVGQTEATKDATDSYTIAIQGGAILAVLVLYRRRVGLMLEGAVGRSVEGRRVLVAVLTALAPAVVLALVFEDPIKDVLLRPWAVVTAWIVGGVALLLLIRAGWLRREGGLELEQIGVRTALVIGLAQAVAMWPGTSRSLVTIVAALLLGVRMAAAVEFSFLLGVVTLGGATVYETVKNGSEMLDVFGWVDPLIGFVAAFVSAVIAVRWMVEYLNRHDLSIFGWYRIAVGVVTAVLLATGTI